MTLRSDLHVEVHGRNGAVPHGLFERTVTDAETLFQAEPTFARLGELLPALQ